MPRTFDVFVGYTPFEAQKACLSSGLTDGSSDRFRLARRISSDRDDKKRGQAIFVPGLGVAAVGRA